MRQEILFVVQDGLDMSGEGSIDSTKCQAETHSKLKGTNRQHNDQMIQNILNGKNYRNTSSQAN